MKIKIIGGFVIILLLTVTFTVNAEILNNNFVESIENKKISYDDDWSMFHHDLQNIGYSTSSAPNYRHILWKFKANQFVRSSPAVANGKIFIGSHGGMSIEDSHGKLYCLDAETGQKIWEYYNPWDYIFSSPAVAYGRVYFGSHDHFLYCIQESDGTKLWKFETEWWVYGSPTVLNEKVYFGAFKDIYCLDAITGELIWEYKTGGKIWSSPAIFNNRVYIGSHDEKLYCLNAVTGEVVWNKSIGTKYSSPAVVDGRVYIGTNSAKIYCLDAETGDVIWNSDMASTDSSPAVAYGKVYIGGYTHIYCFDAYNGGLIWRYDTFGKNIFSSPAVADNKVYIGQNDDYLYCLDANNGSLHWKYKTGWSIFSSPAVAYGKVYVGSEDGYVYAFVEPPSKPSDPPTINGPIKGEKLKNYDYYFSSSDPEGSDVSFYVEWGDGTHSGWTNYVPSGQEIKISHTWIFDNVYQIKAKLKDNYNVESDWATLEVTMSRNKAIKAPFFKLFHNHPHMFPILRALLGL